MLALLREISVRHWGRSPLRSLLVVIGISLGIGLYIATETASASMRASFAEIVARVSGRADFTVSAPGVGIPNDLVATIAETEGVAHAAASLEIPTQATDFGESLLVLGVDFLGDMHFLPFAVTEGEQRVVEDPLAFVNDPKAVLVSSRFAVRHGLTKGSVLKLLTSDGPAEFHVRGVLQDSGPASSFGGQVVVMFLDAAQVSFARGTLADRIDVALSPGADPEAVQRRIMKAVGAGFTVDRPERLGTRLRSLTGPLGIGLWVSGFMALLVGGFLVYNAVGIAVVQRRREIGVLRALGVTQARTVLLFALEAVVLAIPGTGFGLLLGRYLSRYATAQTLDTMSQLYVSVARVEPHLTLKLVGQGVVAGLAMAALAAVWPARRGAAMDPAIVLRGTSTVERSRVPHLTFASVGIVVAALAWLPWLKGTLVGGGVALSLTMVGAALATPSVVVALRKILLRPVESILGTPARLGLDYVESTLGRSSVNVLALMVAVSLSVSVGGWLSSFERSLVTWLDQLAAADLTVTSGSPLLDRRHVPFASDVTSKVAAVPGVFRVQPYRIVDQTLNGKPYRLVSTDMATFLSATSARGKAWPVVEGSPITADALVNRPAVIVSENAARRLGLTPGKTVTLHAPKGDLQVLVHASVVDYTSEHGAVFMDRSLYLEHWGDDAIDSLSVFVDSGASADTVADAIHRVLGGGNTLFVTRIEGLRKQLLHSLTETFAYSHSVELVTLLIALMGVMGTMIAAVLDRTREIGMLRAIGATTRQVATAVVVEAGFLGFCAVVAGMALGTLVCLLFLKTVLLTGTGWRLDFVFPWLSSLRIGGLVVAMSALAGGIPAARAARTDVTGSVVYE